ncbi:hypothetical protein C8J56DRAFT_828881 [Mycena floridula]|nr:hypothetical protein C8J56DRAFT_828881 [Mycena floridula]
MAESRACEGSPSSPANKPLTPSTPKTNSAHELGRQGSSSNDNRYGNLPTPQSPSNLGQYTGPVPQTPETPLPNSSKSSQLAMVTPLFGDRLAQSNASHQMMTPESSPLMARVQESTPRSPSSSTPKASSSSFKLDFVGNSGRQTPPPSVSPSGTSHLSSPFTVTKSSRRHSPQTSKDDDFFATSVFTKSSMPPPMNISTPPTSPPLVQPPGGEMERLRQSMMQEKLSQIQDLESRRPDYMKRMKRTLTEADPTAAEEETARDFGSIGITETPNKGRRLKLFQETSEESFEESLMAGGYGRYRTADWVRQPQPTVLGTPGIVVPEVISLLEEPEEPQPPPPPTEKELKKRKRLAAFQIDHDGTNDNLPTKLFPVQLEGKGRVLLDIPNESYIPEPSLGVKKRPPTRRRKKGEAKERQSVGVEDIPDHPNWPDTEFPWRLRTEERTEIAKAEEMERLQWIEKFLERESDDEEEGETPRSSTVEDEEEEAERPRPGRGKMVPLRDDPRPKHARRRSAYFPSDPADARAALLSKRSVRALSYRQQRRDRDNQSGDEEIVCICRGTDDGRELVQCDDCKMWFHLQCIGIQSISQLGKEEDPWFCRDCSPDSVASLSDPEDEMTYEPTLVQTDDTPSRHHGAPEATFFQGSIPDSPNWGTSRLPQTPPSSHSTIDYDALLSSGSTHVQGPMTPRHIASSAPRIYSTPGSRFDEDTFDPTSTPSRGVKFSGGPFNTPKSGMWRPPVPFQTPSKPPGRGAKTFGGAGFLQATLDDRGPGYNSPFDSPTRRGDVPKARRILDPARPIARLEFSSSPEKGM